MKNLVLGVLAGLTAAAVGCSGPVKSRGSSGSGGGGGSGASGGGGNTGGVGGTGLPGLRDAGGPAGKDGPSPDGPAALDNRAAGDRGPDNHAADDRPPGNPDGGGSDRSGEASGPIAAFPCTSLFCEDFEKATLDPAVWSTNNGSKDVVVQTGKFAHGQRAVKFHGYPNSSRAYIYTKNAPAALRSHLFGRVYFYFTPHQIQGHGATIWAGPNVAQGQGPFSDVELGDRGIFTMGGSGDRGGTDGGKILLDQWMCIEWEFNDQAGTVTLWQDGKQTGKTFPFGGNGGLPVVGFGINLWAGSLPVPTDLYMDDIAMDAQRIGCYE